MQERTNEAQSLINQGYCGGEDATASEIPQKEPKTT